MYDYEEKEERVGVVDGADIAAITDMIDKHMPTKQEEEN